MWIVIMRFASVDGLDLLAESVRELSQHMARCGLLVASVVDVETGLWYAGSGTKQSRRVANVNPISQLVAGAE